uniref:Poly(A) RNA polymerase mitochondrial-like central palm domain-containing protein n=1 Tax=Globisporangium ultimum (strain ATCC 200006 / CBS 805.95 / DAOM BR144) TaxID=431595 RepID=K3WFP7_GLOUD
MAECAAPPWRPAPATTPQKPPRAAAATRRDGENSGAVCNSSCSPCPSAASNSDDPVADDADAKERKKKHSGPRKRRPKKKVEAPANTSSNSNNMTSPTAVLVASTGKQHGHETPPPPVRMPTMPDELETLLQAELMVKNVADTMDAATKKQQQRMRYAPANAHMRNPYDVDQRAGAIGFALPAAAVQPGDAYSQRQSYAPHYLHPASLRYSQSPPPPASSGAAVAPFDYGDQYHQYDRSYWTQWVIEAAEKERTRRLNVLRQLQQEEEKEVQRRRKWAIAAIEREQEAMMREMFLDNMKNTQWFQSTISRFAEDYEVVCPNSWFGCMHSCMLKDLESHVESCVYRQVPDTLDQAREDSVGMDFYTYDVVCPNAVLGCNEICSRENLAEHLASCPVNGISREKEWEERLEGRRNVLLATEEERARRMSEQQQQTNSDSDGRFSFGHLQRLYEEQTAMMQVVLHDEIMDFYEQQEHEALQLRPWITQAIDKAKYAIQDLWGPKVQVEGYGSFATQLHGGYSDVDLVVFGVTEENKMTCQQCVGALAAHLTAQTSKKFVEISAITRASIPLLKVVVLVNATHPEGAETGSEQVLRIPFDITFDDPIGLFHNGIASAALISKLSDHFYGLRELAFVLKHFLAKRGLNDPYVGGLSSYGLLLMIIFILLEQGALVSSVVDPLGHESDRKEASTQVRDESCNLQDHSQERVVSPRYEAQREKGEKVAQEIIRQSITRQQLKQDSSNGAAVVRRKARRPHLPSLLVDDDDGEHDAKPYLLGKYLMDFLQYYGNDFRQNVDVIVILGLDSSLEMETPAVSPGSGRSSFAAVSPPVSSHAMSPPPTLRSPPPSIICAPLSATFSPLMSPASPHPQEGYLMIRDPLQPENNVGKTCYRVSQVCRDFSDFLSFLTALIVRGSVMTTGKKKSKCRARNETDAADQQPRKPSYRILTSIFEMKTRETRASMDLTTSSSS